LQDSGVPAKNINGKEKENGSLFDRTELGTIFEVHISTRDLHQRIGTLLVLFNSIYCYFSGLSCRTWCENCSADFCLSRIRALTVSFSFNSSNQGGVWLSLLVRLQCRVKPALIG
jgi:hypothetical protein